MTNWVRTKGNWSDSATCPWCDIVDEIVLHTLRYCPCDIFYFWKIVIIPKCWNSYFNKDIHGCLRLNMKNNFNINRDHN